jgi:hypothetical protein
MASTLPKVAADIENNVWSGEAVGVGISQRSI